MNYSTVDALAQIENDLQTSGLDIQHLRLERLAHIGEELYVVAFSDGNFSPNARSFDPFALSERDLLAAAAESTQDFLLERHHHQWPICAIHNRIPRPESAPDAHWTCANPIEPHVVAAIGALRSSDVIVRGTEL